MSGTISLQLLALVIYFGAITATLILTRNSTKLRQNFFRQLTFFIGLPLFFLSTSFLNASPPKPVDLSKISESVSAETVRADLKLYEEEMELYLDSQRFIFTLWLISGFIWAVLPTASLAHNYMRHLERTGVDEDDRIF